MPEQSHPQEQPAARRGTSRRRFLGGALAAGGVVVGGGAGAAGYALTDGDGSSGDSRGGSSGGSSAGTTGRVPFYGDHQAGIVTPAQDRLTFAAFDVTSSSADDVARLLGTWAAAAARMAQGQPLGPVETLKQDPPVDTGEALGLSASRLSITVGFGPGMFDDRFGLASRRPQALDPLPALPRDALRPELSDGDLCVQACADDPTVAFHVVRNFARLARGTAVLRWSQLGFGRTSSTSANQETERNLMGFKDGTRNIKLQDDEDLDDYVWVGDETDQPWMRGGSYLVSRRIRMLIESWDTDYLQDQEEVFGRYKTSGAPLTGSHEFDTPDLGAKSNGQPVIGRNAHIRLANPHSNGGQKILRRGYSYTDGIDPDTGFLDAGLFFIAFQKDPHDQFVRIQRLLGARDDLNEYIRHTSSALFAVPPGLSGPGDWWGKQLFT